MTDEQLILLMATITSSAERIECNVWNAAQEHSDRCIQPDSFEAHLAEARQRIAIFRTTRGL